MRSQLEATHGTGPVKMRIEGMDCGACAIKIENALKRIPGLSDIRVNYSTATLLLQLDEDRTSRDKLEGTIRALGYVPVSSGGASPGASDSRRENAITQRWWTSGNAQAVISTGGFLAAALFDSVYRPDLSQLAFGAAALAGLVPIAYRAAIGAMLGTPFSIETLMTLAALGAVLIGAAEEAAVVVFLFAVGEFLETIAAARSRAGIESLMKVVPRVARIEEQGKIREATVQQLKVGDIVLVRPGDRVPSDGRIIDGQSEVDESPISGETVPVAKTLGDAVLAGSINAHGMLRVRITHAASDNTISRIIHMVEEAQESKAPTARFIDRFSTYYTPAAMAMAALVMIIPPLLLGAEWHTWLYRGLAILLIACPCALVISTPAAIASALAAGARHGLLIKGGGPLETLSKIRTIAFDKTGTLTLGRPHITDITAIDGNTDELLAMAASVERGSSHPLGIAIVSAAEARGLTLRPMFGGATAVPGKAVTGRLREGFVSIGSPRFARELRAVPDDLSARIDAFEAAGQMVAVVLLARRCLGFIALRDEPRADAAPAIAGLRRLGVRTIMLTGDNGRAAEAIAKTLNIEARSELLPDAKLTAIAALKSSGPVAMIGDGINDAPALAAASVGVAMGSATDVALEAADATLLKDKVFGVVELIQLSRATLRNIWQNIAIALGLKFLFLATTLTGVTSLWMAILADTGATVLVTANALRLLRFRADARDA
jgi:Cd2+/Zn2+-exporting ATPase